MIYQLTDDTKNYNKLIRHTQTVGGGVEAACQKCRHCVSENHDFWPCSATEIYLNIILRLCMLISPRPLNTFSRFQNVAIDGERVISESRRIFCG